LSTDAPVIRFDHVEKWFGSVTAVEDATFAIGEGEFFSLLGPSGCGKTTSLRLIAGFERPTAGRVLLDGVDVSRVPPYRRNVNTVFQQYALFPHLDVFDNVAFGLRSRRVGRHETLARVREALEIVRLPELARRKPSQLSGGQQQRVALARALVNRPRALLLDEPLGALDLKLREAMQAELARIQREVGSTFVYVTHDQAEALTMSDRIAVMDEGRVVQIGTPQEIYHRPASAFVASFIGNANLLPARVAGSGGGRVTIDVLGGGRFSVPADGRDFLAGEHGVLVLRPEELWVTVGEPAEVGGRLAVTVIALTFGGPNFRCHARSVGGAELVADIGPHAPVAPRVGDRVWMSWADGAAYLVPDAPAARAVDLREPVVDLRTADGRPAPGTAAAPDGSAEGPVWAGDRPTVAKRDRRLGLGRLRVRRRRARDEDRRDRTDRVAPADGPGGHEGAEPRPTAPEPRDGELPDGELPDGELPDARSREPDHLAHPGRQP
jgi:spermidine/putrescine transport system ATP-binding protein